MQIQLPKKRLNWRRDWRVFSLVPERPRVSLLPLPRCFEPIPRKNSRLACCRLFRSVIEVVERALTVGAAFPAGEEAASRFAFPEQIVMTS